MKSSYKPQKILGTHCKDARLAALRDISKEEKNYVIREYLVLQYCRMAKKPN